MDHSKQHLNRGKNTMFHGSIPALVTPFKNGAVDRKAFADLVERQIAGGSAALVPVGTTGETSTLSTEEHKDVVTLCVEVAAGRVPVIAGAGSNATDEAIDLVAHAKLPGPMPRWSSALITTSQIRTVSTPISRRSTMPSTFLSFFITCRAGP